MKILGMGDSLMQFNDYSTFPQTGWFQELNRYLKDPKKTKLYDFALNGRSTKSFIDEGQYQKALDATSKGDFVLISFGHNDEKYQDLTRYCPPFTTYQENLERFYKDIISKGATPVFLSSIERMKYDDKGVLIHSHGDYIKAMEEVCKKLGAIYIDLNKLSYDCYSKHSFDENRKFIMTLKEGEFENYPSGQEDTTHLTYIGAINICNLVVPKLKKIKKLGKVFK